jgi:predicted RNA binding protein YcfA (HicA-like mRNA interferase family)
VKRVSGRELMRILQRFGWQVERIRGSHHIMRHPQHKGVTLSVAVHGNKTLPLGTQASILKDAGIPVEEFDREA